MYKDFRTKLPGLLDDLLNPQTYGFLTKLGNTFTDDKCPTAAELNKLVTKFATTEEEWPLVKHVTLWGPWNLLRPGLALFDVPGFLDTNAARSGIVDNHLASADIVLAVANGPTTRTCTV